MQMGERGNRPQSLLPSGEKEEGKERTAQRRTSHLEPLRSQTLKVIIHFHGGEKEERKEGKWY